MVIINKFLHTKRNSAKSKKTFVGVLAVVLSLLITASVLIVAVPAVSAKGESPFQDNECIYIDCSQALSGGGRWDDASAELRVFTFYNNSDDSDYCHEFAGNFNNDGWYTGSNVLQAGIKADKFSDHIFRFRIPSDKISHVRIARTRNGATEKWNLSPIMWDNQRNKSAGSKSNCIKITGWDNSASWTTFSPTNNAASYTKTAQPDSTITGNSTLYPIDAKFYDYYNDDEIQNGWRNINYDSNHASVHWTSNYGNNSWYWWAGYWEPFQYLNKKISAHGGNVPLYFGNFYGKGDNYTGEGASNLTNFRNQANNSQNIYGLNNSVAGLTGGTLSNEKLVYSKEYGYNSDTTVPFFDESFLSDNKVGSVVNSKFPMRKVVNNGITTYTFDSYNGYDNVWLNNLGTDSPTVSYAQNSKKAIDSLYSYSTNPSGGAGGDNNGYGFFPFDGDRTGDITAKNYGFGMRVDVDFNLGSDAGHLGQIKGTNGQYIDQVFNFTGDDDVWVYVDGKLILDLGGDHKRTVGSINFANKTVTANTGVTFNNATRNQNNFTLENEDDPTAEHTLTMFYVERGMIESNLSFNFNFAPVSNQLVSEKIVNTAELNAGIKDLYALKNADSFTFTSSQLNGKQYSYAHTDTNGYRTAVGLTANSGKYTLRNKDTATFNDQIEAGTTVSVTESFPATNVFTYGKTSWEVVDTNDNNYVIAKSNASTTQSLTSQFVFKTHKTGTFDPTKLKLTYTNTPNKANAVIKKNVIDYYNNDVSDTKSFSATVSLSFDKGATYNTYPLKYTVTGESTQRSMSSGQVTLQEGKDITIPNLPVGTYVRVVENTNSLNGYTNTTGTVVMQVPSGGVTRTITNKQPQPGEATATIQAKKQLTGANLSDGAFEFELLNASKSRIETAGCTANGSVTFTAKTYSSPVSNEVYYIREIVPATNSDSDVKSYDTALYKVVINVTKSGNNLVSDVKYYPVTQESPEQLGSALTGTNVPTFNNVIEKGEVTIVKEDNVGADVEGVEFGIYKVSGDGASLNGLVPIYEDETRIMTVTINSQQVQKSAVKFSNLNLYSDNTYRTADKKYQWYAVAEIDPATGYFKSNKVIYFQLPISGSYTPTFSYVNGHIVNPNTSGGGMFGIKMLGIYAIAFAGLIALAFVMYNKRKVKKSARHFRAE